MNCRQVAKYCHLTEVYEGNFRPFNEYVRSGTVLRCVKHSLVHPHTTPGSSNSTPTKVVVVDIGGCGQW